jgi:hypothetical protein
MFEVQLFWLEISMSLNMYKEKLICVWNTIELIILQFRITNELPNNNQRKRPMKIDSKMHLNDQNVI